MVLGGDRVEVVVVICVLCFRKVYYDYYRVYGERSFGCFFEGEVGRGLVGKGDALRVFGYWFLVWEEEILFIF